MTVNILNPAAVKLGGRIEYLGFLAGRLESTETKSLQQYFKGTFSSFIFTWLELHERVIGSPSCTGWLIFPVTDENITEPSQVPQPTLRSGLGDGTPPEGIIFFGGL